MTPVLKNGQKGSGLQVFSRWSRKSYAAFASMKKEIKISCINTSYNLLVTSKEYGFSGFCFVPENSRDGNELDELETQNIEIIQRIGLHTLNDKTSEQIEHELPRTFGSFFSFTSHILKS